MTDITKIVLDYLDALEVCAKGIATVETLAGGPVLSVKAGIILE
jgi:hypothetical protein